MKILYLEDHQFFGDTVIESLKQRFPDAVFDCASSYNSAKSLIEKNNYDFSLLDVILQNGKTGIQFAETYKNKLGNILFITGCIDQTTLDTLKKYNYINKDLEVIESVEKFIKNNA
jgi:response regulator of citrate/malate metabolism